MTGARLVFEFGPDDIVKRFVDLVDEVGLDRIDDRIFFEEWLEVNGSSGLIGQSPSLTTRYHALLGLAVMRLLHVTESEIRRLSITPNPSPLQSAAPAGNA